jgi:PhnB protein
VIDLPRKSQVRDPQARCGALDDRVHHARGILTSHRSRTRGRVFTTMVTSAPDGWRTVTPRITVDDASDLVAFLKRTFRATGRFRRDRPSEIRIGDSLLMISEAGSRAPMSAFLYVYVDDVDSTYRRALGAGATPLEEPQDLAYGDRRAMVKDRWGNLWQIAARKTD